MALNAAAIWIHSRSLFSRTDCSESTFDVFLVCDKSVPCGFINMPTVLLRYHGTFDFPHERMPHDRDKTGPRVWYIVAL